MIFSVFNFSIYFETEANSWKLGVLLEEVAINISFCSKEVFLKFSENTMKASMAKLFYSCAPSVSKDNSLDVFLGIFPVFQLLTSPTLCILESYIKIKIKFLFSHFFVVLKKVLWRSKTFWGTTKKCENLIQFFPSSGIETGSVNFPRISGQPMLNLIEKLHMTSNFTEHLHAIYSLR